MKSSSFLAIALLGSACATDVDSDQTEAVATYTSRTGTTIEVYPEASTGFSVMEHGDQQHAQRALANDDVKSLSPTQIYLKSAIDGDVPAGVQALTDSLVARGAEFSTVVSVAPAPAMGNEDGCDATEFKHDDCDPGNGLPITWCMLDHINGAYEHIGDQTATHATLCMKHGGSTWKIANGDGGNHLYTLRQGDLYWYGYSAGWFSGGTWLNFDVTDAHGSTFQFGGWAVDF